MDLTRKARYPHALHLALAGVLGAVMVLSFLAPGGSEENEPLSAPRLLDALLIAFALSYSVAAIPLRVLGYQLVWQERLRFTPWQVEDALLVVGGLFLLQVTAGMVVGKTSSLFLVVAVTGLIGFVACAAIVWIAWWKYALTLRDLGVRFNRWTGDLGRAAALFLIVIALRVPVAAWLHSLYEERGEKAQLQEIVERMRQTGSSWEFLLFAMTAVLVAAVWEEFFFRGFLQPFLRRYLGAAAAILLTAVAFALVHYNREQLFLDSVIHIFPLAIALGVLRYRTQRLTGPIFLHALHNGLTVFFVFLTRGNAGQ